MSPTAMRASSGIPELDIVIDQLRKGDNVVWQVERIEDYASFIKPYIAHARSQDKRVVYIRFGNHAPLAQPDEVSEIFELNAYNGFEIFTSKIHTIITEEGLEVSYIFDCLSDLLDVWATDQMVGNFFAVTCPYLFELDTIAYFALLRYNHSHKTIARIRDTTQLLIDLYSADDTLYLHPLKVWNRYSDTMFLPHVRSGTEFVPITNSGESAQLFTRIGLERQLAQRPHVDYWDRIFVEAENAVRNGASKEEQDGLISTICRLVIGRDEKMVGLFSSYTTLEDLLHIKSRIIGSGFIGGKTVGMLVARKIISQDSSYDWEQHTEPHDSFFIGSDVFYTYVVHNGWWKLFMRQKTEAGYFEAGAELHDCLLNGQFPEEIQERLYKIIEYFGQAPIIVRSSSLLEDSYGNAFAGKYESIFCVNQGSPGERYKQFEQAIRTIFASSMNEDALAYRKQRGLENHDEQMALLVQRVSGSHRKKLFFPDVAGVGVSYNAFVWERDMDPSAGMLRLVFGLGTRAVNRIEGDYARIVALDRPLKKAHAGIDDTRKYSQHEVDLLNIESCSLETMSTMDLFGQKNDVPLELIAERDEETNRRILEYGLTNKEAWIITFDTLLSDPLFTDMTRGMLKTLEQAYHFPVEIEFTVNFSKARGFQINLLQCRPFQAKGLEGKSVSIPPSIPSEKLFFQSQGNFMGGSISIPIRKIISVNAKRYSELPVSGKHDIARLVGTINKQIPSRDEMPTLILGPGRWGTSTPSMGIPVIFSEVNNIVAMAEVAFQEGNLIPELSFGTHFFHDLVETDIFYAALFPDEDTCDFRPEFLESIPNSLAVDAPQFEKYENVVRICDVTGHKVRLLADMISQQLVCYSDAG